MIIDGKCPVCRKNKKHLFRDCLSVKCECVCVQQLYTMHSNKFEDKPKLQHPKFLEVSAPEVIALPNRDWAINNFSKINKKEWVDTNKKDKRRKNCSLPNYFGH